MKEKVLISACLLGTPCRYDGASKPCRIPDEIISKYDLIPFCPEVAAGLSTPRLPCEIQNGRVIRSDGKDLTTEYQLGAEKALQTVREHQCKFAILKEKSPSCGKRFRYDGSFQGKLVKGCGITCALLEEHQIKVLSEEDI